ncbi:hypothetical protein ABVK25_002073 [Lepraria finkii]|uniref:Uncharacterized protein n=1 Tax=Lepraria finkii TaxID=1340010 RepID=A0ABR4BIP1_9LECA
MTTQQNLRSDQSNQLCLSFEPGKDFSIALNTLIRRLVEKIPKDQMYSFHYLGSSLSNKKYTAEWLFYRHYASLVDLKFYAHTPEGNHRDVLKRGLARICIGSLELDS